MLSIINPVSMAMNVPCCPYAPCCAHNNRQMHPETLPSLGLGLGADSASSWNPRSSTPQQVQYDFNRPSQSSSLLRQNSHYVNEDSKLLQEPAAFPMPRHATTWSAPNPAMLSHDFGDVNWAPARNRSSFQGPASSSFPHGPYDYLPELRLDPFELKEGSPSRATDFSTVSASTESSPAPTGAIMGYDPVHLNENGDSYLPSQPLPPEQITLADEGQHRSISPRCASHSVARRSRSRRKGSEVIHCEICHKCFDRRSNFKSHWETHDKDRQRTMCKMDGCNKTFGRPAEMTRHVNSAHRQKLFPCPSCGKEFTRHDILLRHSKDACPALVKGKSTTKRRRDKTT